MAHETEKYTYKQNYKMNHFIVHRSVTARATRSRHMYAAPAACALPDSATPDSPHTKPRKDVLLSFALHKSSNSLHGYGDEFLWLSLR